ncbi:MAG: ATP-binding protein [Treponema sp.]|nr:ATP-binding protein [Treponema sp.]
MKKIEKTTAQNDAKINFSDSLLNEINSPLQIIQASAKLLENPVDEKTQLLTSNLIKKNVQEIKNILENTNSTKDDNFSESNISFENQNISIQKEIPEKISIGIFSKKDSDNSNLRLVLQSYGFFVRIIKNQSEVLAAIQENLIQMLIISPENENDKVFSLCTEIRNHNSPQDFAILMIVNKFNSFLIEKLFELKINDYLLRPFDVSALIFRIQEIENYRNLNQEKQELLKSEQEKNTFLYFVTHNVNTPLTLLLNEIQNLSELYKNLPEENKKNSNFENTIQNIQKNARAINIIIQNVLDSYKISDRRYIINPKILNLENSLKKETEFLSKKAENKNQNFIFKCSVKEPCVFCDEYSLKGIYENLVDNAIKYTKYNGNITVSIEEQEDSIILNVIDDGQGIPKEKQEILFDRFAKIGSNPTGSEKSCGLGLFVVNEICKLNNLILEYSENKSAETGSIFSVKFKKVG